MKKSSLGRRPPGAGVTRKLSDFQERRERSAIPMSVRKRNPSADRMSHLNSFCPPTPSLGQTPSTSRPPRPNVLSTDSLRHSSFGGKSKKESRPIHEKEWQMETVQQIQDYLRNDEEGSALLKTYTTIKNLSLNSFLDVFNFFLQKLDCNNPLANKVNYLSEIPSILKRLDYKGKIDKSVLQTVNAMHSWPYVLGILQFMAELVICMDAFNAGGLDLIYSNDFKENEPDQDDCDFTGRSMCEYIRKCYDLKFNAVDKNDLQRNQDILILVFELLAENGFTNEMFAEIDTLKENLIHTEKQYSLISSKLNSVSAELQAAKELYATKEAGIEAVSNTIEELNKSIKNVTVNIQETEKEIKAIKNEIIMKDQVKQRAQQEGDEIKATHDAYLKEKAELESLKQSIEYDEKYIHNLEDVLFQEGVKFVNFKSEASKLLIEYNKWMLSMLNLIKNVDKAVILNEPTKISTEQINEAENILLKIKDTIILDTETISKTIYQLNINQEQDKIRLSEMEEECEMKQHELNKSEKSLNKLIEEHEQKKQHFIEVIKTLEEKVNNLKIENDDATKKSNELEKHVTQLKSIYESRNTKLQKIIDVNNKKLELRKQVIYESYKKMEKYLAEKQNQIKTLQVELKDLNLKNERK